MPSLLGGPREDLSRLAGLSGPVPSTAVSDDQPVMVGQWFLSVCECQSRLCLPQLEAGSALRRL